MRCDELWVFGTPSNGVDVELAWARARAMPVQRFALGHYGEAIHALAFMRVEGNETTFTHP